MPVSITIRNVPEETRNELAARAALTGRSLQEYLRACLIELAEKPDAEAWVARVRQHQAQFGESISLEEILTDLDADRR
jgi:plasmid stability protein